MFRRDFLNAVVNGEITNDVIEFAKAELTKIDAANEKRRENPPKAVAAKRAENAEIGEVLYEILTDAPIIVADLRVALAERGFDVKAQRVNAIAHKLIDAGRVTAEDVKVPNKGTQRGYKRA